MLYEVITRPTEGHPVIERDVLPDLGGFPDHHPHPVVDEEPLADGCTRVDLNPRP